MACLSATDGVMAPFTATSHTGDGNGAHSEKKLTQAVSLQADLEASLLVNPSRVSL